MGLWTSIPDQVGRISHAWQLMGTWKELKTPMGGSLFLQISPFAIMDLTMTLLILIILLCFIILLLLILLVRTRNTTHMYWQALRAAHFKLQDIIDPPSWPPRTSFKLSPPATPSPVFILECPPTPRHPPPQPPPWLEHSTLIILPQAEETLSCTPLNSSASQRGLLKFCSSSFNPLTHKKTLSSPL